MKHKGNIEDLTWLRLFTSSLIPVYLVEQIAKRDYTVNDLYTYLEENILRMSPDGPTLNPIFNVWGLIDKEKLVKGFLWFTIDPLSKDIAIQVYSVDSHYWGCKGAILKLATHMKELRKRGKLKKVYWITKFPKHSLKYGFKPSKNILMEYNEEEKDDGKYANGISGEDESLIS